MLTKDHAICIRTVDYSETSQIVTFFTKSSGKISVIAKGSKRPKSAFEGPIEMFSHGKIVFSDSTRKKLVTLTEFQQQSGFTALAADLFALNCSLFAAELTDKLTDEHDPHTGLFDGLLQFLQNAQDAKGKPDALLSLILFQLTLLKEIGLKPVLNACANCKNPVLAGGDDTYFSSLANGLICRDCEASFPDKIRLSKKVAGCLSNLKLIADADGKTLNEIENLLIQHFTEILQKQPRMAKYIMKS